MKKKILALVLAVVMTVGVCGVAGAEGGTVTTNGGTQGSNLSYEVTQAFTVTIPESSTITGGTGSGEVSVTGAVIPFGKNLTVTITEATNYADEDGSGGKKAGFNLKDGTNENYLSYSIKNGVTDVAKGTAFLTVAAGTATGTATLNYNASAASMSGTYTDQLTFTVAIAD